MLQVTGLTKHYGPIRPVKGLTFSIGAGEVVGLLGVNGAGKSTTMRMLSGYLAPTSGQILLSGIDMVERPRAAKALVGYLPESPPLYPDMTAGEQLRFCCDLRGLPAKAIPAECARVAALLDIAPMLGRLNAHLSKGYRQRVGFACALIGSPRLLILDEPTSGLDPRQMIDIRALIASLSADMSVLISSHLLPEVESVATRLLILSDGELRADGAPADILAAHGRAPTLELTLAGDTALAARLLAALLPPGLAAAPLPGDAPGELRFALPLGDGAPDEAEVFRVFAPYADRLSITRLARVLPSLEDVFLDITQRGTSPALSGGHSAAAG